MQSLIKKCLFCDEDSLARSSSALERKKFCSKRCQGLFQLKIATEKRRSQRIEKNCNECGLKYFVAPYKINSKFCSLKCKKACCIKKDYKVYIRENTILDENGCWKWLLSIGKTGYGVASIKAKKISAHRLSYQSFKGEIPSNLCVCHSCDVRDCVNPDHLWLGTYIENNHDCINKGRKKRKPIAGGV